MAANSAWADAVGKVLAVEATAKNVILTKAKKDHHKRSNEQDESDDQLEFVQSDGTVVKGGDAKRKKLKAGDDTQTTTSKKKKNKNGKLSKHEWEVMHKLKPSEKDRERERLLCSIATKGVVQLFNAVKEQQKTIETKIKEVGTSETKRDKMMSQFNKSQFLDKLKQKDRNKNTNRDNDSPKAKNTEEKWKVLKNDYMIGAKMKDWDKESDSDESS